MDRIQWFLPCVPRSGGKLHPRGQSRQRHGTDGGAVRPQPRDRQFRSPPHPQLRQSRTTADGSERHPVAHPYRARKTLLEALGMRSRMPSSMKLFDRIFDKLPRWAKVIWMVLTAAGTVYCVARYGWRHTLLHVIFS